MTAASGLQVESAQLDGGAEAVIVRFSRPEKRNAITPGMYLDLRSAVERAGTEEKVRAILITGSDGVFSAGADLAAARELIGDRAAFDGYLHDVHAALRAMRFCPKPVIGLVNGLALAGALELILACDFSYAAASAVIGDCHQRYGMAGGGGALTFAPLRLGYGAAAELVFTAVTLSAAQACAARIVTKVFEDSGLMAAGLAAANSIAACSPAAIAVAKTAMAELLEEQARHALEREAALVADYATSSPHAREGLNAFYENRRPDFTTSPR